MKYNTGNPLGSADPRDLYDTATVADNLVHGEDPAYTDRLGKSRKSWAGMEKDFDDFLANSGYELLGDYAAGIEVTAYNQIIREGGEFWRAAAGTVLPYTTTGTGMPEGGAFVSAGDAVLRQDLANQSGAGFGSDIVGHDGGTARAAINQRTIYVGSVAELESLSLVDGVTVYLSQEGRSGVGLIKSGTHAADPQNGIFIDLANGNYWQRRYDGISSSAKIQGEWFGAVGDGTTDSTAAFNAAVDYAQLLGGVPVAFNGGDFLLSTEANKTLTSNFKLSGAGRGITRFLLPASSRIRFTSADQSVQCDLSGFDVVATDVTGLAAIAFEWPPQAGLVTTQVKVTSVDIYGLNNSSYFSDGVTFLNCSNVTINGCLFNGQGGNPAAISAGAGIRIENGYDYLISDCRFTFWQFGVFLYDYAEGVNIDDIKVEYTDYGVYKQSIGSIGVPEGLQLNVTDSHLTCRRRGVHVGEHKAYFLSNLHIQCRDDASSPIEPGSVNGLTDFAAIEVQGAQTSPDNEADVAVIENISFRGSTTNNDKSVIYGIVVEDAKDLIIRDCPALSNLAIGIILQSGTTNVNVRNIINRDCTDDIVDDGQGNNVLLREYSRTLTTTLAGGASQESVDVTVPSGILNDKPEVAILQHSGGTNFLVASYDFDSASSTATNLRFNVQRNDSGNIVGAAERFSLYAAETS